MTSSWSCNFYVSAGRLQWYMVSKPTESNYEINFPISIPYDATIIRAWLTMGIDTPLSGSAYQRVNDISIPSDGVVELDGITPDMTTYRAYFTFRANGRVYEDTAVHSGRLHINDPTIHIEYTVPGTPDTPDTPDSPEEDDVITQPGARGGQLPRLLNSDFREVARLEPLLLQLKTKLSPVSTAEMRLPSDGVIPRVRDFVELFSPDSSAGVFRVKETETDYTYSGVVTVYLEHALSTLSDSLVLGAQAMSAPVATVISTLLESQTVVHWQLGVCEVPDDIEMIYEQSYDNLLQAIKRVMDMLPDGYALIPNTDIHPFTLNILKMSDDDACEGRMRRNLTKTTVTMDTRDLCTQIYAFGAGEGTDRVTLTNLIGSLHLDSPNVDTWGYVARTFTAGDIYDALTLKDVAQRYLDRHDHPTLSITADAMDLYQITGETIDRWHLGRMCRLSLPEWRQYFRERVIAIEWPDVYGSPDSVNLTLANRIKDASDEIAELMREAIGGKLLGGRVNSDSTEANNSNVTQGSSLMHYFDITGYGNTLSVRAEYRASSGYCRINVDSLVDVPAEEAEKFSVELLRYLKADENGVPIVGRHYVQYFSGGGTDAISVSSKVTVKTIEKG